MLVRSVRVRSEPALTAPHSRLPSTAGWAALGAIAVLVLAGLGLRLPTHAALSIAAAVVAIAAAALMVRSDGVLVFGYAVLATAGVGVLGNETSSNIGWFSLCVVAACCVYVGGPWIGLAYWAGTITLFGIEWTFLERDAGWGAWMAGVTFTALAAHQVRQQRYLVAQLRAAQAGLAQRSRAEERNRIARELHDVIAHSLTVSLLHVTSARLAVEHDPSDAARALTEAERLGRESLDELRAAVGMLRQDGDPRDDARDDARDQAAAPMPGADALPALADRFRTAGADVELSVDGDLRRLPATAGLAVYRIAQEALTNAAKHAPGTLVQVRLIVGPASVRLTVESAGRPVRGAGSGLDNPDPGMGLGLVSMRERAELLGGGCTAGPGGRGWIVSATLPLDVRRRGAAAS